MLDVLLVILSSVSFVSSLISLALSAYTKYTLEDRLRAQLVREMCEAKEDLAGVEHRLEGLMENKLNSAMTQMREVSQNDSVDLIEAVMSNRDGMQGDRLNIGSFRNIGR